MIAFQQYIPLKGAEMVKLFIEMTDTFSGEANYSWVKRFAVFAGTMRGAVQVLAREVGAGWKQTANYGDMARYDNGCNCIFVEWFDETNPKHCGDNVKVLNCKQILGLPVRDDVEFITYHRPPTEGEKRFGYGATHYADFSVLECCHEGTRIPKKWLVNPVDGLRYYR